MPAAAILNLKTGFNVDQIIKIILDVNTLTSKTP